MSDPSCRHNVKIVYLQYLRKSSLEYLFILSSCFLKMNKIIRVGNCHFLYILQKNFLKGHIIPPFLIYFTVF